MTRGEGSGSVRLRVGNDGGGTRAAPGQRRPSGAGKFLCPHVSALISVLLASHQRFFGFFSGGAGWGGIVAFSRQQGCRCGKAAAGLRAVQGLSPVLGGTTLDCDPYSRCERCWALRSCPSGQDVSHHIAIDIRQAEVAAGVAVGQLFVVETELVEKGGVQIVDVHGIFHGVHAQFIGGAIG